MSGVRSHARKDVSIGTPETKAFAAAVVKLNQQHSSTNYCTPEDVERIFRAKGIPGFEDTLWDLVNGTQIQRNRQDKHGKRRREEIAPPQRPLSHNAEQHGQEGSDDTGEPEPLSAMREHPMVRSREKTLAKRQSSTLTGTAGEEHRAVDAMRSMMGGNRAHNNDDNGASENPTSTLDNACERAERESTRDQHQHQHQRQSEGLHLKQTTWQHSHQQQKRKQQQQQRQSLTATQHHQQPESPASVEEHHERCESNILSQVRALKEQKTKAEEQYREHLRSNLLKELEQTQQRRLKYERKAHEERKREEELKELDQTLNSCE
jgi:hypothetical protein